MQIAQGLINFADSKFAGGNGNGDIDTEHEVQTQAQLIELADTDGDGNVTDDEWTTFEENLENINDFLETRKKRTLDFSDSGTHDMDVFKTIRDIADTNGDHIVKDGELDNFGTALDTTKHTLRDVFSDPAAAEAVSAEITTLEREQAEGIFPFIESFLGVLLGSLFSSFLST